MDKRNLLTVSIFAWNYLLLSIVQYIPRQPDTESYFRRRTLELNTAPWHLSLSVSVSLLLPFLLPFPSFCLLSVSGYLFQTTFSFSSLFVSISVSVSVFVSLFSPFSTRVLSLLFFSSVYCSSSCSVLEISTLVTYLLSVIHTLRSLNKKLEHDVNDKEPCHIWSYFKQWHGVRYDTCGRIKRAIRICQQDAKCIPCRVQILKEN